MDNILEVLPCNGLEFSPEHEFLMLMDLVITSLYYRIQYDPVLTATPVQWLLKAVPSRDKTWRNIFYFQIEFGVNLITV